MTVSVDLMRRLNGTFISKLANYHYNSQYNPPRKAFDFYAAAALVHFITSKDLCGLPYARLFYSGQYGLSLVGKSDTWACTLESYISRIDTNVDPADSDFIKTKKEYFQREISVMRAIEDLPHLKVFHLCIVLCIRTVSFWNGFLLREGWYYVQNAETMGLLCAGEGHQIQT